MRTQCGCENAEIMPKEIPRPFDENPCGGNRRISKKRKAPARPKRSGRGTILLCGAEAPHGPPEPESLLPACLFDFDFF
jgi:hypothetical protein